MQSPEGLQQQRRANEIRVVSRSAPAWMRAGNNWPTPVVGLPAHGNIRSGLYAWLAGREQMCDRFFWQTYTLSSWQIPHSAWGVAGLKRPQMVP